jgi:hypothetical protein
MAPVVAVGAAAMATGGAEATSKRGGLIRTAHAEGPSSRRARDHRARALAIARNIGAPPEEARALECIGQSHIHEGNPGDGAAQLRQALTI